MQVPAIHTPIVQTDSAGGTALQTATACTGGLHKPPVELVLLTVDIH